MRHQETHRQGFIDGSANPGVRSIAEAVPAAYPMKVYLETARLTLREFTEGDLAALVELNADPEVMRHLTGGVPVCPDRIRQEVLPAFLRFHAQSPEFGYWAAVEKQTGDFVGWFQFRPKDDFGGGVELGFRLKRSAWGKGYATEGTRALVARGFGELGVRRVFARAMASNRGSIRVMEKAGLTFDRGYLEPEFPAGHQSAVLYSLTNEGGAGLGEDEGSRG